jgi:hypothetical protein
MQYLTYSCTLEENSNKSYHKNMISKELLTEIQNFIEYNDSIYKSENEVNHDIYKVYFFSKNEKDTCMIWFQTGTVYIEENFMGYLKVNNRIVAFYNKNVDCANLFINQDPLNKEPTEFFIPKGKKYDYSPYEPLNRELKVINKGRIIVIRTFRG